MQGTVVGNSFTPSTVVTLNGAPLSTTFVSASQLTFSFSASESLVGSVNIQTITPGPGGGTSASLPFTLTPGPITYDAAARFLQQATWGATPATIKHVQDVGFSTFLDEQFAAAPEPYVTDADPSRVQVNLLLYAGTHDYSQLRTKMSWAWYKLFDSPGSTIEGVMSPVPEITNRDAFASFSTLLKDITLNVEMGLYLNYCCWNPTGPQPNENFGREILQQFTTGSYALSDGGQAVLGSDGSPQPAYSLADIDAISRAVTGLTYKGGNIWENCDPEGLVPMVDDSAAYHDSGIKQLLGQTLPSAQDAVTDVNGVISILSNRHDTAVHLSVYLIHEFVASNPSSDYVSRVSKVWLDNGKGITGDVPSVIKAILLDPEARAGDDPTVASATMSGRFKDSVNYSVSLIRNIGVLQASGFPLYGIAMNLSLLSHQPIFGAASVFGSYSDRYKIPGSDLLAPEMQLYTSDVLAARAQFLAQVLSLNTDDYATVDWSVWVPLAQGDGAALITQVDHALFHGSMSDGLAAALTSNLQAIPSTDLEGRVKQTLYLAALSPEYAVER